MYQNSSSWVDLTAEYKESYRSLEELKRRRKGTGSTEDTVDCELAGSMMGELAATIKELKDRSLHEFNSISVEDILNPAYGLTGRQRQIALLRQEMNYYEIANRLNLDPSSVFETFKRSISKILKLKKQEQNSIPIGLSSQEEAVYIFYFHDKLRPKDIADKMDVSINTVKGYIKRIKQKTGVKSTQ